MRMISLKMVNFCHYRHKEFDFMPGMTAIIGPNGTGKSTSFEAMRFLFTGSTSTFGNKSADICTEAGKSEQSYVEGTFTHAGSTVTVQRWLRPTRPTAKMMRDGHDDLEGDQAVTSEIEQILGISKEIINDIVIVAQEDIFGFLAKAKAQRDAHFQRLFQTELADKVQKQIGEHRKTKLVPELGVDLDALRQQVLQTTQQITDLQVTLASLATQEHAESQIEANNQVLVAGQTRRAREAELLRQREFVTQLTQQQQGYTERLTAAEARLAELRSTVSEEQILQAREVQQARARWVQVSNTVRTQEVARDSVRQQLAELAPPTPPDDYVEDTNAIQSAILDKRSTIQNLQQFVASFKEGVAACPTCGTPAAMLEDKIAAAKADTERLSREVEQMAAQLNRISAYAAELAAYNNKQATLTTQLAHAESMLSHVSVAEPVTEEHVKQATDLLQARDWYNQQREEATQSVRADSANVANLQGQLDTTNARIAEIVQSLAETPNYTPEQEALASQNIQAWKQILTQRITTARDLAVAENQRQGLVTQIHSMEHIAYEARLVAAWHERCDAMRGLLHKDAAPKFVTFQNLRRLEVAINQTLELFATNYRVRATEDLSFEARFNNGRVQRGERLSGGQRVVLALSFRIALNLMFAENIGALYLDEPTAYQDEHHIAGFGPVFQRLNELATSRGLQCFIVTHEKDLAPLFDTVIQL